MLSVGNDGAAGKALAGKENTEYPNEYRYDGIDMRPATIKRLIELVEDSEIDVLEVSNWWRKVKITRKQPSLNGSAPQAPQAVAPEPVITVAAQAPAPTAAPVAPAPQPEAETNTNLVEIKAPMVGTFYAAPSPESPPFVKVGDSVSVGAVVCIVEAMKLMNEIESEVSGKIAKTLVENGQPVEFGQPLFLVDVSQ